MVKQSHPRHSVSTRAHLPARIGSPIARAGTCRIRIRGIIGERTGAEETSPGAVIRIRNWKEGETGRKGDHGSRSPARHAIHAGYRRAERDGEALTKGVQGR